MMSQPPAFDLDLTHRYFSTECFNRAWDLIDKPQRTKEDDERMIWLSIASLWHWTQRPDCTGTNLSVAYWQVSRVYALLGRSEAALRYAQLCLEASQGDEILPFYLAYAYEALARAAMVAGNPEKVIEYLRKAEQVAEKMTDLEAKKQLIADLETLR
jgi:tetratricopeptide (TPR) repeat protein